MSASPRKDAFWRFIAAFTYLPLALLGLAALLVVVVIWWFADVLLQMALNYEGLSSNRGGALVVQFWDHIMGNIEWVLLGRGKFQWMP
jgi:ABC-type transport system involved in cytochrome bd biosynthesis fused ATPase/permease subunit